MNTRRDNSSVRSIAQVAGAACAVGASDGVPRGLKPAALRMDRLAWVSSTLSLLLLLASAQRASAAGPENPNVTHGSASFQNQNGNWVIHTSNKAIINYTRFDVASGQWVRFIQEGSGARVLNRINGSAPTRIDGSIFANGSVYFVNSAGVIFGQNSVINCASFAAAAGQLSDQNFLAGINHFTNLSGAVINHGRIETADGGMAALVGRHVANYGTIVAPQGTVVMAAGSDVYVGEAGGHVFARIQGDGTNAAEGVRNDGVIEARRGTAMLAAGDAYGMAVINTGRLMARNVKIDGGERGEVRVAGTVDASGKDLGETGGRVEITGENIALTGATIDVSGDSGGGTALIGGGREGLGLDHVAKGLYVDQNSTVNADAIRSGNGGEIVLFSQNATRSFGRLQARGGVEAGNGGFIETSGGWLSLKGTPDTGARALLGIDGTWLIDPLDIEIVAAAPTVDVGGGPIFTPTGGASKLWVEDLKNAFTTSSTVTIKTVGTVGAGTGTITFNAIFDLPPPASPVLIRTLNVLAAGNIVINQRIVDQNAAAGAGLNLNLAAGGNVNVNAQLLLRQGVLTSSGVGFTSNNQIRAAGVNLNHTGAVSVQSIASQFVGGTSSIFVRGSSFDATQSLATGGGNIDIQTTTGNIRFLGAGSSVDAGTGSIVVKAGDRIESNASFNAANVRMDAATQATYTRDIVASNTLELRANVLEFSGPGTINLTAPTMTLRVNDFADAGSRIRFLSSLNLNGNANVFAGRGEFNVGAGRIVNLSQSNKSLLIKADTVTIDPTASLISGAGGRLRFQTQTSGRAIALGSSDAGALALSTAELATIGAGWTNIDFLKGGQSGDIRVDSATTLNPSVTFQLGSGSLRLNDNLTLAGAFTTNGRVRVGAGNIQLSAASAIFGNLVDAAAAGANFTVSSPGLIDFRNSIGSALALNSLTTTGGGAARVRNLVRSGNTTFSGAVQLAADTTFSGGTVAFNNTLNSHTTGFYNATVLGPSVLFGGEVGTGRALASLLTTGNATVNARVLTNLNQTYGGTLTIGGTATSLDAGGAFAALGPTVLSRSSQINAASAYFGNIVDASASGVAFVVNSPGEINFTRAIGSVGALESLRAIGGGLTHFNESVRVTGAAGFIDIANAAVLDSDVAFLGPAVTFQNTVDSGLGGTFGLTAGTPGSTLRFQNNVGSGRSLAFVNAAAIDRTIASGNIGTLGNQDYSAFEAAGLAGNRVLSALGGDITFNNAVGATTNTTGLEIDTGGLVTFNSTVGSGLPGTGSLAEILRSGGGATILRGDTTTVGQQSFDGDVRFAKLGLQTINAGGPLTITGKSELENSVDMIVGAADLRGAVDSIGGPRALHVTSAGLIDFGSTIGAVGPLASLLVDGGGETRVTTLVDAATATFNNAVNLTGDTIFQGGTVTFNSTLDALAANAFGAEFKGNAGAGTLDFTQNVGQSRALAFLISRIDTTVRANVSTANQQQFDKNLAILGPSTFNAGGLFSVGGNTLIARRADINANGVTFTGLVDSGAALPPADRGELFVTSPGAITFAQAIGSADALRTLDVSGGGLTTVNATIDADNADFRNATELGSNVTLRNGTFTFHQTLDSALGGPFALNTLGVGTLSFRNAVGGTRELLSLDASNAAQTLLGGNVTTQNFARFGATQLDADSLVRSSAGGNVDFGVITAPVARALAVDTAGVVTFGGSVGSLVNPLTSLTVSNASLTRVGGDISTNAAIALGNTQLDADSTITSLLGGNVAFGTITSPIARALVVDTAGVVTFAGPVASLANPLASLTVNNASLVRLGGDVTTNGLIALRDTQLDASSTITSLLGGAISFGTITSPGTARDLIVDTTNVVTFAGPVGSLANPLASLSVNNAILTRVGGDISTNAAIALGATQLDADSTITSLLGGNVTLGTITSPIARNLVVDTSGLTTFNGDIGSAAARLASLRTIGSGTATLRGDSFTAGQQSFAGNVAFSKGAAQTVDAGGPLLISGTSTLGNDLAVVANGAAFNGAVDSIGGPRALHVTSAGLIDFGSTIGATGPLASLLVDGGGETRVTTLVDAATATFNNAVSLTGNTVFQGGTVTFNSTLDALAANAFGAEFKGNAGLGSLDFAQNVGQSRALAFLISRIDTTVRANVSTANQQQFDKNLAILGPSIFNAGGSFSVGGDTRITRRADINANGVSFTGLVDSGVALPPADRGELFIASPGAVAFSQAIGSAAALRTLDVSGGGLTTINATIDADNADFRSTTELGSNVTLRNGTYTFHQTLDSALGGPFALNTLGVGTLSLLNTVGGTRELLSLDALNAAQTVLGANVTTRSFARFAATRLDAESLVTSTNAGAIDFGLVTSGGVPRDLATNSAGVTTFNADVGSAGARLSSLRTLGGGSTVLRGDAFTTGTQSFAANAIFDSGGSQIIDAGGPLFVGGTSTLRNDLVVLANGATFTGAVDGDVGPARSLTVTSASPILFGAAIGQTNALQSILVNGGGATTLNSLVRTTAGGNADFQNAVLLGSDLNLNGGTFRFGQTLDSGIGGPFALASTGSNSIEFVGNVGIGSLLRSIDTALAADTRLHADLAARDAIRLSTLRLLDAANKNIASSTGAVDFLGAVASDTGAGLNVAAPGTVTFASTVGSGIPALGALGFLNRTGGGLTVLNATTTTTGSQAFDGNLDVNGPLTLNAGGAFGVLGATRLFGNTIINSTGYLFNGSVDSAGGSRSLTLNNTGSGEFKGGAGFGSALSALTINGVGTSTFAGNIRVVPGGSMIVNQGAFIAGPSDFRAGTITFNGTLDAAPAAANSALILVADATNFNFNVGTARALSSIDAAGVTLSRVAGNMATTGTQRFAGLLLTGAAGSRSFSGSSLAYLGAIDAANNTIGMIASGPAGVGFAGNIGLGGVGGTNLSQLIVSGPANLAGNVRTVGGTSFGSSLTTIGARTIDAAGLFVGGQTVLGGNFTVNTANAQFNNSVDSAVPGLASMLVNATNTAVFGNGIGQNRALSTFRSNAAATVLRGAGLRTLASGQSWFAGELRIDSLGGTSTINTGTIFIARDVFTDGAAAGAANLSLLANAPSTIEGSAIRIGGSIGQSSVAPAGTQRFNNLTLGGAIGTPNIATILLSKGFDAQGRLIAASVNPSDQFSIVANNIAMSPGQKLTALGSLGLFGASSITLGDVATLGNLSVNSPVIRITSRGAGNLLNNTGAAEGDIGTDIVAGGTISFSSTPTLLPGAGSFSYSAGGGPDPLLASFSYRQLPSAINLATFRDQRAGSPLGPNFLLFLDLASRGPTSTNVAETKTVQPPRLGEVARVRQSVVVDPADQELLRQLGLTVRGATNEEIVASFAGYSYYVNVPQKLRPSVENREYVVTADRLWMQAVVELSKAYNATMKRTVVEADGRTIEQLRDTELRQTFEESWDRYIASSTAKSADEELQGFMQRLLSDPGEAATRQELANLGGLLAKLDDLGLTKLEAGIPRGRLLQRIRPAALSPNDMTTIIEAVTASGVKPQLTPAEPASPTQPAATTPAVAEKATKVLEVSKR
jgi:filamentous hemagglutinin family protein